MIDFRNMPPHSRTWIYQSGREFSKQETAEIKIRSTQFIDQWTSHGKTMNAAIELIYNRFIVVCVDEQTAPASGCGIDKSVHFIQQLEKDLSLTLLDRMNIAYKKDDKIISCSASEFETKIQNGEINDDTIVFNNMVTTKKELESSWEIRLKNSWQAKFLV